MALHERPETPDRQLVAVHLALGPDRRAAGRLVDQRHLAERLAGPEPADLLAVDGHGRLATIDHDAGPAGFALLGDCLSGWIRALDELGGEPVQELLVR